MKISRLLGFVTLTSFVMIILVLTLWNLILNQPVFLVVFSFFSIGAIVTIIKVFKEDVLGKPHVVLDIKKQGVDILMVVIGSFLTYIIHINTPFCIVLSSGLIGILAALFVKKYQVALYCGSFVGMSSPLLLGIYPFILASLLAGLIYILVKDVFNGYGGKLGTIALSGALITSLIAGTPFLEGTVYTLNQQLLIIFFSTFAATITYTLSIRFNQGPVLASGFVGFFLGAVLRFASATNGLMLAIVVIGASFAGMSNQARLKDERFVALAGVLFGLIFIFSAPFFGGAGGKLGTIAFLSVFSVHGITLVINKFQLRKQVC
ncbi:MAG: hypothetical protein ACNA7U_03380 [Candidatus Izemoplasmataceae bacterium]